MRAWNNHFPRRMLYEKYKPLIWGKNSLIFDAFLQAMYRHQKHNAPGVVVLQTKNGSVGKTLPAIANMVNELYARKLETMGPEDISVKDFSAANRLVLDEKKLKLDQNEQLMELAKLFGIPEIINPLDVIKGEDAQLRSSENEGNKQISP